MHMSSLFICPTLREGAFKFALVRPPLIPYVRLSVHPKKIVTKDIRDIFLGYLFIHANFDCAREKEPFNCFCTSHKIKNSRTFRLLHKKD